MDEQEIAEHRYRFFSEKALSLTLEHDKILVTLFTGIVAGLLALVVYGPVGFFSGVMFLISAGLSVAGLASCLLHMSVSAKALFSCAALFGGEDAVPNLVEGGKPTEQAIVDTLRLAQRCYSNQLFYLFAAVAAAGVGLAIELWIHVFAAGIVVAVVLVLGIAVLSFVVIRRRASSRD